MKKLLSHILITILSLVVAYIILGILAVMLIVFGFAGPSGEMSSFGMIVISVYGILVYLSYLLFPIIANILLYRHNKKKIYNKNNLPNKDIKNQKIEIN